MSLPLRQLAAIFAKLRAKGLLRRFFPVKSPAGTPVSGRVWSVGREAKLISRIPAKHQAFSNLKSFKAVSQEEMKLFYQAHGGMPGAELSGFYDSSKGAIYVSKDLRTYVKPTGYTGSPAHIPTLRTGKRVVPALKASYKSAERNARIGSAKAFYHEYGHSIDHNLSFSNSRKWRELTAAEWGISKGETGYSSAMTTTKGFKVLPPHEAWSEAYAMYATSKASRVRLKRERPDSYAFMQKFFGES